jgi:RHS repeat-associated protein
MVTGLALGSTSETWTYNTFGELARQTATFAPSTPILDITYDAAGATRDNLGRIVRKTEVIGGVTTVYQYTYDALRRLTDVTVNGALAEHFEYDQNGNRTLGFNAAAGTTHVGVYDDQDRLLSYGPWVFTYTANGELETKTNTATNEAWLFQYDVLGNLLTVGLPNGDLVEYLVDGGRRRIAKKVNGTFVRRWLYRNKLKPVAELDGSGALVAQFVYGTNERIPDYVVRAGTLYRVLTDQLGSPRHVVSTTNSADVPFLADYTSFGEMAGTGLDWMPFGFAGGIYDADSGLVRFGARDYDPLAGRWTGKEPLRFAAGGNFFVYALNDPINLGDPNGLSPMSFTDQMLNPLSGLAHDIYNWLFGGDDIGPDAPEPDAPEPPLMCGGGDPLPRRPREICRYVNHTELNCFYICKPSNTLLIKDRPTHPITGETPHNDNCPRTAAGP